MYVINLESSIQYQQIHDDFSFCLYVMASVKVNNRHLRNISVKYFKFVLR